MILESIVIQDFRKLADRLAIDGFEPGLNIIAGPNETGKSTIAEAIRTVFLERYKVTTLGAIVPSHRPDGQPTVEVRFSIGGVPHVLRKSFVRKSRCELRIGQQSYSEDEAEEKLAELLGFSRARQGTSRPEHAGIPGLLWVRQGQTDKVRDSGNHAINYIRDALTQLSGGDVAGGEDVLIRAVQAERGKLLTKTARTTGALAEAETTLAELNQARGELNGQKHQFDENIGELARLQAEHEDAKKKRPWEAVEQKAADARKRAEAFGALERARQELMQKRELTQTQRDGLLQQEKAAVDMEQAVERDRKQLHAAQASGEEAAEHHRRAVSAVADAQKHHDDAHAAHERAMAAETATLLASQATAVEVDIARLADTLTKAESAQTDLHALTAQMAQVEIDAGKLKRLRAVVEKLLPLQARKDAALTRIEYRLTGAIVVDGTTLEGSGALLLESEKTLTLPGLGELVIKPGETSLAALIDEWRTLDAERARLLLELGVADLAEATARHDRWQALAQQKTIHAQMLALHAPKGIDTLRDDCAAARARLAGIDEHRARLPDVAGALPLADARSAFDTARSALDAARQTLLDASEKKANAVGGEHSIRERLTMNEARLAEPDFVRNRESRQSQLIEKDALLQGYARELDECGRKLDEARLDDPAAEEQRFARSATNLRAEHAERDTRLTQLRTRLETLGASGIGERLAHADAGIEQQERRHRELRLRADALQLLESVLVEERDTALATLRAPLTERIGHYLKRVFPAGELSFDDALTPSALVRGEQSEALDSLSYGTQEQLGILARLAYADLLKAAGRPTLLVFDDAVVHTDDARRDGIKRALLEAARRHQILVLTCHPGHWDDMGVKQRFLADLKDASRVE